MSEVEFKKGDKVRFADTETNNNRFSACSDRIGLIGTVKSVTNMGWVLLEEAHLMRGYESGMAPERFEIIPSFNVGDRVRFLDTISTGWWFKKGRTGVIEVIKGGATNSFHVRVDDARENHCAYVDAHHIELIKEEPVKQEEVIKVGDTVECINNDCMWYFTVGKHYEVKEIGSNGDVAAVDDEGDTMTLSVGEYAKVDLAPRFVTMWDYGHSFHPTGDKPFMTEAEAEKHALEVLNSGEHTTGTIAVFEVVGKHTVSLTVTSEIA